MASKNLHHWQKVYAIVLALLSWSALILQLIITNGGFFNFISYFTILSNFLVAANLTITLTTPISSFGKYFSSVKVQSAIALYIFIVGLVYNFVLRGIWQPTGWQLIVDNLLHVAVPILYVLYWTFFTPRGKLNWIDGLTWAYFPLSYLIYSLIRGHFTGWYPYPFLNVNEIGYPKVLLNSGLMIIAFIFIGWLLIAYNRFLRKKA